MGTASGETFVPWWHQFFGSELTFPLPDRKTLSTNLYSWALYLQTIEMDHSSINKPNTKKHISKCSCVFFVTSLRWTSKERIYRGFYGMFSIQKYLYQRDLDKINTYCHQFKRAIVLPRTK